ncbi:hypothetical protein CR513_38329, partial [Mucuna pruriens]
MSTPMHLTFVLSLDDFDKKVDQTTYNGMIGSLLYLTTSRPDTMFSKFRKNNIAPMRLDTIHLTLPKIAKEVMQDVNPLQVDLTKESPIEASKGTTHIVRTTRATSKRKKRLILPVESNDEIEDDDAPLISRMTKRKAPIEDSQGLKAESILAQKEHLGPKEAVLAKVALLAKTDISRGITPTYKEQRVIIGR